MALVLVKCNVLEPWNCWEKADFTREEVTFYLQLLLVPTKKIKKNKTPASQILQHFPPVAIKFTRLQGILPKSIRLAFPPFEDEYEVRR